MRPKRAVRNDLTVRAVTIEDDLSLEDSMTGPSRGSRRVSLSRLHCRLLRTTVSPRMLPYRVVLLILAEGGRRIEAQQL